MTKELKFYTFTKRIPMPQITSPPWHRSNKKKTRKEFSLKMRNYIFCKGLGDPILSSRILSFLRGVLFKEFRSKASHETSYIRGVRKRTRLNKFVYFISRKYSKIGGSVMNTVSLRNQISWAYGKDLQDYFNSFLDHFFRFFFLSTKPTHMGSKSFSHILFTRYRFFSFFGIFWFFLKIASEREEEEVFNLVSTDFCKHYYNNVVYCIHKVYRKKDSTLSKSKKSREHVCYWLKKISGSVMKKKKHPIDDVSLSRVMVYLRSFLREIHTPDVATKTFFASSFYRIRPYYQILYQNRPRSRIGVYKYYLSNRVRDTFPIRLFFKSLKYTKMSSRARFDFEQRLARCIINVQDGRGVAVGTFRQFFRKEWGVRLVNKYGLTDRVF